MQASAAGARASQTRPVTRDVKAGTRPGGPMSFALLPSSTCCTAGRLRLMCDTSLGVSRWPPIIGLPGGRCSAVDSARQAG
jgi:hypothetical protein